MPFFVILLVFLMLFPYLLIPVLIFFGIGILFLLPYVLIFNSFYNVITIPWQILKIAADRRIRKNHSLEHATVNVLEERYGRNLRIGGLAYANGFSLSGPDMPSPYEVMDAAREGHYRMTRGESNLAIHPRCGTSIAAANFLFSLVFILLLFFYNHLSLLNLVAAFLLANVMAKPFGLTLQKFFTTHPDVSDVEVLDIYGKPAAYGFPFEIILNPNRTYFIRTCAGRGNAWRLF
ncbi:DUF6391 domain-containing protein [Thermoanaerobacterium sp. DL9XJH110]|jgi:hypothetical protein|uniref:DUF6391 domain-containing protein n=1 Tax=Thermoanaerobacterium sp. DL9XJH110 TaxID=3386643 RepID=UPI003BB4D2AD